MTTNTIFRDAESGGLNAFIDRPNADTAPDFHLNADMVTAIVQHELGKLGLWWAKEQRALVQTRPDEDGDFIVLDLDDLAGGPSWCSPSAASDTGWDPVARAVAAYLATLPPAAPKPGETWELNDSLQTWEATVVEICGTLCFAWPGTTAPSLRPVDNMGRCTRRKIADAPSGADQ